MLLGGSVGMLIGSAVDAGDMAENASLLEKASDNFEAGVAKKREEIKV